MSLPWPQWTEAEWRQKLAEPSLERALARSRKETPVHAAADAHMGAVQQVVAKALAAGRAAVNGPRLRRAIAAESKAGVRAAVAAVPGVLRVQFQKRLPRVLKDTFIAGGEAGVELLMPQLKAAGGPGSGRYPKGSGESRPSVDVVERALAEARDQLTAANGNAIAQMSYTLKKVPVDSLKVREQKRVRPELIEAYQQPETVTPISIKYYSGDKKPTILDGHRRLQSAKAAGLKHVWVVEIHDTTSLLDEERYEPFDAGGNRKHVFRDAGGPGSGRYPKGSGGHGKTNTPEFKQWFADSKVVDEDGDPIVVYHGTTHNIQEFKGAGDPKYNPESDWGAAPYFTNEQEDVGANYAGEGPDLTSRIEQRAEQIQQESEISDESQAHPYSMTYEEALKLAREELTGSARATTMPVYLSAQNPYVVGEPYGDHPVKETFLTMESEREDPDDEDSDYGEPTGTLVDFVEALRDEASDFHDTEGVDEFIQQVFEEGMDGGLTASRLDKLYRSNEKLGYVTDDNGRLVTHELYRRALERAGFDGVIDRQVNTKFGSERQVGRSMVGMDEDTVHYVVFKPTQIKSAIGNRRFDRQNPLIVMGGPGSGRYPKGSGEKNSDVITAWQMPYFNDTGIDSSRLRDPNTPEGKRMTQVIETLPVMHGVSYRGLTLRDADIEELQEGKNYTVDLHSSASLSEEKALNFAFYSKGTSVLLEQHGDTRDFRSHLRETLSQTQEVIVPAGTRYRVRAIQKKTSEFGSYLHVVLAENEVTALGGPGSGNFGHAGRPGEVGGSNSAGGASQNLPTLPKVSGILAAIDQADGGFTYHAVTGEQPTIGFALSPYPDREEIMDAREATVVALAKYARKNWDLLQKNDHYLGGWHNPSDGKVYLDVSRVVDTAEKAEHLARQASQLAYFDLVKGQSIKLFSEEERAQLRSQPKAKAATQSHGTVEGSADAGRPDQARPTTDGPGADAGGDRGGETDLQPDALTLRTAAPVVKGQPHTRKPPFLFAFDRTHPKVTQWAFERATELAKNLSDTTREGISDALVRAFEEGDLDQLYDDILDAVGDEDRAELIARSETMLASSNGQREAWEQAVEKGLLDGDETREWIATGDNNTCPICEELNGKTAKLGKEYPEPGGMGPPQHPRCMLGFTHVEGSVIAATRMLYTGYAREFKTRLGRTLTVTPNHPVATTRGFLPARLINKGDNLLLYNQGVEHINIDMRTLAPASGPVVVLPENKQNRPTMIAEVFQALVNVGCELVSVPRFGDEFHTDAMGGDGNIDIVYANSQLRNHLEPAILNDIQGFGLESTDTFTGIHAGISHVDFMRDRVGVAETVIGLSAYSTWVSRQTACFGLTTELDAVLMKMTHEFDTRDVAFAGKGLESFPAVIAGNQNVNVVDGNRSVGGTQLVDFREVSKGNSLFSKSSPQDPCRDAGFVADLRERLPTLITLDEVIEVRDVYLLERHVYDLETVSGVIVAEGLVISNCRCTEGIIG